MMLPPFPFGYSFHRRPIPPHIPYYHGQNNKFKSNYNIKKDNINYEYKNFEQESYSPRENNNKINNLITTEDPISNDDEYFDFFGLKLHSDDLLLIGLLFFLYQEDVKDTYLYIALILLLLS